MSKQLTQERKGEIAFALIKWKIGQNGIRLSQHKKRDISNLAKALGVDQTKLEAFFRLLIVDLMDKMFESNPRKIKEQNLSETLLLEEKYDIALRFFKYSLKKEEQITLQEEKLRDFKNNCKKAGVPYDEAMILLEEIVREGVEELFSTNNEGVEK